MSIVCPTCPLDFHCLPSVNLVPLSPLHKGTTVSAPAPLLFEVLCVTCLRIVLGRPSTTFTNQQCSLIFALPLSRYNVAKVIRYINCRLMKGWVRLVETKGRGRWWRNTTCTFEHKAPLSMQDPPTGSCVGISQLTSIYHACLHPLTFLFTSIPFFMSSSQKHVPHKSVSHQVVSHTLIIKASKAAGSDSLMQPLVLDPRTF